MDWGWDNARAILGLAVIVGICWAVSENRKAFPWKIVLGAVALLAAVANELSQHLKHYRFTQTYGSSKGRRNNKWLLGN